MSIFKSIKKFFGLIKTEKTVAPIVTEKQVAPIVTVKKVVKESKRINKHLLVKNHLIEKQSITSWQAIELFGATRLSAIIYNFRKRGMNIESIPQVRIDRYGNTCKYVLYYYVHGNN